MSTAGHRWTWRCAYPWTCNLEVLISDDAELYVIKKNGCVESAHGGGALGATTGTGPKEFDFFRVGTYVGMAIWPVFYGYTCWHF